MDKFIVIKNALVLTLDSEGNTGYFNIVIKNDKIIEIDYNNELSNNSEIFSKYPGAYIIDAHDKLVVPAFFDLNINTSQCLNNVFLRNCNYENFRENLSIISLEKYFKDVNNKNDLRNLFAFNYYRAISNGTACFNETSSFITKDFILGNNKYGFLTYPQSVFTCYNNALSSFAFDSGYLHCLGIKNEEDINNYSLNSLKSYLNNSNARLFLEVLQKPGSSDSFKNFFSKSFIKLLSDNELLTSRVILSNPVFINNDELIRLQSKKGNIVICPKDIIKMSGKINVIDAFLKSEINLSIGTGLLGKNVFSELKLLYHLMKDSEICSDYLFKMITLNSAVALGVNEFNGSLEKNKFANLVFFNLSDIKNIINVPEINSERICELILENLEVKDISDVLIKGVPVKRAGVCKIFNFENLKDATTSLSKKIFEIGKYFELKEKSLMRKRINDLSNRDIPKKELIYQDFTNDTFVNPDEKNIKESEFRIIGLDKEIEPIGINDVDDYLQNNKMSINELSSLESGFITFDEDTLNSINEYKKSQDDMFRKDVTLKFSEPDFETDSNLVIEPKFIKEEPEEEKPEENKPIIFQKTKLRFGFSDEEKK